MNSLINKIEFSKEENDNTVIITGKLSLYSKEFIDKNILFNNEHSILALTKSKIEREINNMLNDDILKHRDEIYRALLYLEIHCVPSTGFELFDEKIRVLKRLLHDVLY